MKKMFFSLIVIFLLSSFLFSQNSVISLYDVNGWSYGGAWGETDMQNTGMAIEEGPTLSDSVQLFSSYGWTVRPDNIEWVQVNAFGKINLPNGPYLVPQKVLIDFNIKEILNVELFGINFVLMDTTNGGYVLALGEVLPIIFGWQTISINLLSNYPDRIVSAMGLEFVLYSIDSTYVGTKIQANNLRFVFLNGDTILVDPFQYDWLTDVEPISEQNPTDFVLKQNYPNPFNPSTKISWQSPAGSWQVLKIFDVIGNEVATLVDEYKPAGSYEVEFNASNIPSGVYFYRLQIGSFVETKKMILLK